MPARRVDEIDGVVRASPSGSQHQRCDGGPEACE